MRGKKGKTKTSLSVLSLTFWLAATLGILIAYIPNALAAERHIYSGESIQTVINFASPGDVIIVHQGTYPENINFLGKPIIVRGTNPNDPNVIAATVIDGCQKGSVVTFDHEEGNNSVLSGVTIKNGKANSGGGIYCSSSPRIENCIITNNSASTGSLSNGGGGISCYKSSPIIVNCTITQNSASSGGGISCNSSSPSVANCIISGNSASYYGGGVCEYFSSINIINCTIIQNSASSGGGIFSDYYSKPSIKNCILWNNSPMGQEIYGGNPTVIYSDIQGGYVGIGNINSDPIFINPSKGNYQLWADSPCIDAGSNEDFPDKDKNGVTRPHDGNGDSLAICDIGAYEALPSRTHRVLYGESIQSAIKGARDLDVIIVEPGTYVEHIDFLGKAITVKSTDSNNPDVIAATIIDGNQVSSISSAVTFNSGEGIFTKLKGFTVQNANSGGGIYLYSSSPILENCTISGNSANYSGGGIYSNHSSLAITNCTISGNSANGAGGGIYSEGSYWAAVTNLAVTNCTISGNSANGAGGGIYSEYSYLAVTNCTISGNLARDSGGIYSSYSASIKNCILWNNSPQEINENRVFSVTYSNIQRGCDGIGNINADPLFVNPAAGDYRLQIGSPCIDAGDPNFSLPDDKDGVLRPYDGNSDGAAICDLGAYEFSCQPIIEICDGVDNDGDGNVDEDLTRPCSNGTETEICQNGKWVGCTPTPPIKCVEDDSGALDIEGSKGKKGQEVQVLVRIQSATKEVSTLGFEVMYDPDILEYSGYERGDLVKSFTMFDVNVDGSGRITVGGLSAGESIPKGALGGLVRLKFKVKGGQERRCYPIQLQKLKDHLANFSKSGGCFCPPCTGDLNGDGEVTPADALIVFKCYLGSGPCSECCDVDGSGEVTPADALCLFKKYLGQSSCLD